MDATNSPVSLQLQLDLLHAEITSLKARQQRLRRAIDEGQPVEGEPNNVTEPASGDEASSDCQALIEQYERVIQDRDEQIEAAEPATPNQTEPRSVGAIVRRFLSGIR